MCGPTCARQVLLLDDSTTSPGVGARARARPLGLCPSGPPTPGMDWACASVHTGPTAAEATLVFARFVLFLETDAGRMCSAHLRVYARGETFAKPSAKKSGSNVATYSGSDFPNIESSGKAEWETNTGEGGTVLERVPKRSEIWIRSVRSTPKAVSTIAIRVPQREWKIAEQLVRDAVESMFCDVLQRNHVLNPTSQAPNHAGRPRLVSHRGSAMLHSTSITHEPSGPTTLEFQISCMRVK